MNKIKLTKWETFFLGVCVGSVLTDLVLYLIVEYYIQS